MSVRKAYFRSLPIVDISQNADLGALSSTVNALNLNLADLSGFLAAKADASALADKADASALDSKADSSLVAGLNTRIVNIENDYATSGDVESVAGQVATIQSAVDGLPTNYVARSVYDADVDALNQFAEVASEVLVIEGYPGYVRGEMQDIDPPA
jgi:hypothetical protein